ncbi:MAG: site-specific integrase [Eubacterium sp.]
MPRKKEGRAAQGAGTIRQRSNGSWEARYTLGRDPATGKQIQKSVYGKSQAEVRRKLAQITVEIDGGTYQDPSRLKVGEWLDIWQSDYLNGVKDSTKHEYAQVLRSHIVPALGDAQISKIQPHHIQKLYNQLCEKLTAKTVKNIHGVFHKAMAQAVALGYIKSNPTDLCTLPKIERFEISPLDKEQIPAFIAACPADRYGQLIKLVLFTGFRLSEVIGLTWDCVDFEKGTIRTYRQLQRFEGAYTWGSLKNGKPRMITASNYVMAILKDVRTNQLEERLAAGSAWQNPDDFIFTHANGRHLSHSVVRRHFKDVAQAIGMPALRFHDLRHSFAVVSLQAGDDIKTVQENLGHHSAAFTLDTYAHVTEAMKKESAQRMDAFIQDTL